ncbi:MAG TPA: hypothetical protein GXZ26_07540 [Firmicutes bacterium]|jgi:hypothetical protein|nr:hypothetical protein [Bacillota bacterium]
MSFRRVSWQRVRGRLIFSLLLAALVFPAARLEGNWEQLLVIKERAGVDWRQYPVTIGIPVPRGEPGLTSPPRLFDPWGREVPVQAKSAGVWPGEEGPRWWLLTFLASVNRKGSARYRLVSGDRAAPAPASSLVIEETAGGLSVDTGTILLELKADKPIFHQLWFDPSGRRNYQDENRVLVPGGDELALRIGDEIFRAQWAAPAVIILEEEGPIKAVIKLQGRLCDLEGKGDFTYTCRIEAYAGAPYLQVDLTLTAGGRRDWLTVDEAWIRWALAGGKAQKWTATLGSGEEQRPVDTVVDPVGHAGVQATSSTEITWEGITVPSSRQQETKAPAVGWGDLTGEAWGVALGVQDFWQQYPKRLLLTGGGEIRAELIPAGTAVRWPQGAAKTHRFFLYLHTRRDREYRRIIEAMLTGTPVGLLAASWYEQAGVFAQPFAPLPDEHPEEYTEVMLLKARSQVDLVNLFGPPAHGVRINPRYWGFFNYGDLETAFSGTQNPGRRYWNNNCYDLPYLLLQEFIRTGDPVFLTLAGPALTHLGDVDLVHPSGGDRVTPGLDHVNSFRTGELGEAEYFSYAKNRGLLLSYYLFGDYRGRELAIRVADRVCLHDGVNPWEPRTFGLGILATLAGYEVTGEEKYLRRADELARAALAWEKKQETGFPSDFIYQAGLALEGLVEYYYWQKDPAVFAAIKSAVDKGIYHFWDPEVGYLQNEGGLTFSAALALLHRETGEERYREIGLRQIRTFLASNPETQGRPLTAKEVALIYRNIYSLFPAAR